MALCVDLITYFTTFVIPFMIVMLEKAVEWCWCNIATKYKHKRQLNYHDDVFQHPNLAHPTSIISKCHLQVVTTLLAIVIVFAVKCLSLLMPVGLLISNVYPESSVNIFFLRCVCLHQWMYWHLCLFAEMTTVLSLKDPSLGWTLTVWTLDNVPATNTFINSSGSFLVETGVILKSLM